MDNKSRITTEKRKRPTACVEFEQEFPGMIMRHVVIDNDTEDIYTESELNENVTDSQLASELLIADKEWERVQSDQFYRNSLSLALDSMSDESTLCTNPPPLVNVTRERDALLAQIQSKLRMCEVEVDNLETRLKHSQKSVEEHRKLINEKDYELKMVKAVLNERTRRDQLKSERISKLEEELKCSQTVIAEQKKTAIEKARQFKAINDSCNEYRSKSEKSSRYQADWALAKLRINQLGNELKQSQQCLDEKNKLIDEKDRQLKEAHDSSGQYRLKAEQCSQYKVKWESAEAQNGELKVKLKLSQEIVDAKTKLTIENECQLKEAAKQQSKYQEKLEAAESKINKLNDQLNQSRKLADEQKKLLGLKEQQLDEISDSCKEYHEKYTECQIQCDSAESQIRDLKNELKQKEGKVKKLTEQHKKIEKESGAKLKTAKTELAETKKQLKASQKNCEDQRELAKEKESQRKEAIDCYNKFRSTTEKKFEKELNDAEMKISRLETDLERSQALIVNTRKSATEKESELKKMTNRFNEYRDKTEKESKAKLVSAEAELAKLKTELRLSQKSVEDKSKQATDLHSQIKVVTDNFTEYRLKTEKGQKKELEAAEMRIDALEKQLKAVEEKNRAAMRKERRLNQKVADQFNEDRLKAEEKLKETIKELNEVTRKNTELSDQVNIITAECKRNEEKMSQLARERCDATEDLSIHKVKYELERIAFVNEKQNLENNVATLNEEKEVLSKEVTDLRDENAEMMTEIAARMDQVKRLNARKDRLEAELSAITSSPAELVQKFLVEQSQNAKAEQEIEKLKQEKNQILGEFKKHQAIMKQMAHEKQAIHAQDENRAQYAKFLDAKVDEMSKITDALHEENQSLKARLEQVQGCSKTVFEQLSGNSQQLGIVGKKVLEENGQLRADNEILAKKLIDLEGEHAKALAALKNITVNVMDRFRESGMQDDNELPPDIESNRHQPTRKRKISQQQQQRKSIWKSGHQNTHKHERNKKVKVWND